MRFDDIKPYTQDGNYATDVPLVYFKRTIEEYIEDGLQLNPDFQRGHVWTEKQQTRFIEHVLRRGKVNPIYLNQKGWMGKFDGDFVCVDGLQRITACMRFLDNEIPAFGAYYKDFEGKLPITVLLRVNVNDLKTRAEVLQWYLELNTGGTVHTDDEIERVKALLEEELAS